LTLSLLTGGNKPVTSTIFTIGFTKKTAEEFFRLLQEAGVQKVVDVRENRVGQLAGFSKYPDLPFFLDRILTARYEYQPLFAPSAEIRDAYRKTHDWAEYEKSFAELMEQRKVLEQIDPEDFAGKVALLCSEPGPEECHRRLVAEMVARHWNSRGHQVEVKHLVVPKPTRPKRRVGGQREGTNPF
jgi:uncharacterized protein (DUF488 family)